MITGKINNITCTVTSKMNGPTEVDTAQLASEINHTCNCRKVERPDISSLERSLLQ